MQIEARSSSDENPFTTSDEVFEGLKKRLSGREALKMTHGELERLLDEDGRELLRCLLQDHLDLRGPGEAEGKVVGASGVLRTQARLRTRHLKTVFGTVEVGRLGYSARDADTLFPKDAELNLPAGMYSHELQRRVVAEVIKTSFDQAGEAVDSTTGTTVPKRQLEEIAVAAAEDFTAFYEAQGTQSKEEAIETGELLVTTTDAKGIVMRTEDLREATRKAAEQRTHKMTKRLSRGEKRNGKRMAQVASVYTVPPFARSPEDIVKELDLARVKEEREAPPPRRPRPEDKRVWASVVEDPAQVICAMFEEARRRDPSGTKKWVTLVDGNMSQLRLIKAEARRQGVAPTIIVDIIHVLEYLWKAAFALHGEGSAGTERWVSERLLELLRGRSSDVAAGMRRSATLRKMKAADRAAIDDCADYLLKYRQYLRYDVYLAAGMPIATGVIEGACRHLIKDRMDITGARWGLEGAEAIVRLRSLRSSGDLEEYWRFHERAELRRNHLDRFRGTPPTTKLPLKLVGRPKLTLVK
jgi:hypothetical protein